MRTFILMLLAGSYVRSALATYAPARGDFPVETSSVQGYIRYLDANGAERLIAYTHPQPLYDVLRLPTGGYDIANPLPKSSVNPAYSSQAYIRDGSAANSQLREQSFRDLWEQRFQTLNAEVENLRAAGQKPSQDILTHLNSLQSAVVPATYNPDDQLLEREEQLRLWNEARLKVLQLEAEQLKLQDKQPSEIKPIYGDSVGMQTYASSFNAFAPIQETLEQQKTREEHLRAYNEHLLSIQQLGNERFREAGIVLRKQTQSNAQTEPDPVQTPEQVVAETDLTKLWWNKANLRAEKESKKTQQAEAMLSKATIPRPTQDTPEVIRTRDEHLKLLKEAQLKLYTSEQPTLTNVQYLAQTTAADNIEVISEIEHKREEQRFLEADRLREDERIKQDERFLQAELLREAERIRHEEKIREAERVREAERLKEEERLMEAERLRLKLEEDRRSELERQVEAQRLEEDDLHKLTYVKTGLLAGSNQKFVDDSITQFQAAAPVVQSQIANTVILNEKRKDTPILLRIATQPGTAGAYIFGEQKPKLPSATIYYNPAADYVATVNPHNPFLVRYVAEGGQVNRKTESFESGALPAASPIQQEDTKLKLEVKPSIAADSVSTYTATDNAAASVSATASVSTNTKLNYDADAALSELEKATREHFRAHEIALEQLRLAKLQNPSSRKDC